jgi:hypothetical protein
MSTKYEAPHCATSFSCYFIPLWSKNFPSDPALKHPQSMLSSKCCKPSFTPIQNSSCSLHFPTINNNNMVVVRTFPVDVKSAPVVYCRLYTGCCDGVRLPSQHCGHGPVVLSPGYSEPVSSRDRLGLTPSFTTRAAWPSTGKPLEQ